jgi:hypothetical protein
MKKAQANRGRLPAVATAAAALAVAATLASCSHNDDDRGKPPVAETPNPPGPPVATTDAFITYVSQQVATADETSEPASVDGVAATAPENTEPQPLPAS